MAVAGGVTACYVCQVIGGQLAVSSGSILRSLCVPVEEAVERLSYGEQVVVAGSDMALLRQRLQMWAVTAPGGPA